MSFLLTILSQARYFILYPHPVGWLVWLTLLSLTLFLIWRWRRYNPIFENRQSILFAVLLVLVPFTSLFIGFDLAPSTGQPLSPASIAGEAPVIMLFASLPWMVAALFLGPAPAAFLAGFSGALIGLWHTHDLFTPIQYALFAVLFSAAVRQRYRSLFFSYLQRPVVTAAVLGAIFPLLFSLTAILTKGESFLIGADFPTHLLRYLMAASAQILIGGLLLELGVLLWQEFIGPLALSSIAPEEISMDMRFFYLLGPFVFVLFVILFVGVWVMSARAAEDLIKEQVASTGELAADSIPFFLETGQSIIVQIASNPDLASGTYEQTRALLQAELLSAPYFNQFFIIDTTGATAVGYPADDLQSLNPTDEELQGIDLALQGIPYQSYSIPPIGEQSAGQLSFIAALRDQNDQVIGALLGRSDLASNPLSQSLINGLSRLNSLQGEGMLIDPSRKVLYHSSHSQRITIYNGPLESTPSFFQSTTSAGAPSLSYNHPVPGRSWTVLISIPAAEIQEQSMSIAVPLLGILSILAVMAFFLLRIGLQVVKSSLANFADQSKRIAAGEFDQPFTTLGSDEIGKLGDAFEAMRLSLKSRMDELNRILSISQQVASTLDLDAAIQPILEAALSSGATSAHLALTPAALPEFERHPKTSFGLGEHVAEYQSLNRQIIEFNSRQDLIILNNPSRAGLRHETGMPPLGALIAAALRSDDQFFGSLWIIYNTPHRFDQDEIDFISSLASHAAFAVANARIYLSAKVGRQHLEAVLDSTSDPVLVTDYKDHLLLANPAAVELFSNGAPIQIGSSLNDIPLQENLRDLMLSSRQETASIEVSLPKDRVYFASASPVAVGDRAMGRVCVLHDITYLKELDTLKTDFINTVSHDLRSPLALMRGHTTMMETVGDLNPQQVGYLQKINHGIGAMSELINNLLDLGRFDVGFGLQPETIQLEKIAQKVIDDTLTNAAQKRINVSLHLPEDPPPAMQVDPLFIYKALHNMVSNAITFTPHEGEIKLTISTDDEGAAIAIQDNGIGIAPIDQPHIFDRFYRVDREQQPHEPGSGLGLAIVKTIAEQHGGKVWLESQLGSGSTFHLFLPFSR
ncbi:MAG: ATP-binding protein [Anaerolineae bacterium]|nr:ATP-binding protein [Anaerolineae bacterium]